MSTTPPLLSPEQVVHHLRIVKAAPRLRQIARDAGITEAYLHHLCLGQRPLNIGTPAHRKLSTVLAAKVLYIGNQT